MRKNVDEEFIKLMNELEGKLLIVEGRKDEKSLRSLGLRNIIALNGKSLPEIAYEISKRREEVVILTDFDHEGRKLAAKLNFLLRFHRKCVNSRLRRELMKFGKNRIEDFKNFEESDIYGEISANFNKIYDKSFNKSKWCSRKTRCNRSHIWTNRGLIR